MAAVDHAVLSPYVLVANLVIKWFEKSDTCPQCRAKLSTVNPFIRDYILERITDKYARTILSAEEILDREQQALYSSPPIPSSPFILSYCSWDVLTLVHSTQLNAKKTKTQPRNPKNSNPGPRAQGPSTSPSHRNKSVSLQQVSSNSFPAV